MFNVTLTKPGQLLDWYPEQRQQEQELLVRLGKKATCKLNGARLSFRSFKRQLEVIAQLSETLDTNSKATNQSLISEARQNLRNEGLTEQNTLNAMAIIGEQVKHTFGFTLHPEQFYCAWSLLQGTLAEMATGEGKSITAGITAIISGLAGVPVHVITANDYLVSRDAESMRPLYEQFGLTCSAVTPDQEEEARRTAYRCDVCYVSNKQLVFDYLRDRQSLGNHPSSLNARLHALTNRAVSPPLLRGLCFAIVDEADSIFIDDAITPLILSHQVEGDQNIGQIVTAISLARRLNEAVDFYCDQSVKSITLSEPGEQRLADMASGLDGIWKNRRFRHELVRQALSAVHLFHRDIDYLVRDGTIVLIDQSTGRVMPDRKLQHGLHQMIETKERCELTGQSQAISSLSFQNFFPRYMHLCGMTGTGKEASQELQSVYNLAVVSIPTHRRNKRKRISPSFARDNRDHIALLVETIRNRHHSGQPILVGTRTLAQSELLSEALSHAGLTHQVLNARQDHEEARVIAQAGIKNAITIATNIAGRGTDISLKQEAISLGGLHVIIANLNDNFRIDRQLIGRSARQGDPGSYEYVVSLEDPMLQEHTPRLMRLLNTVKNVIHVTLLHQAYMYVCRLAQNDHMRRQVRLRKAVALQDKQMHKRMAFSGYKE